MLGFLASQFCLTGDPERAIESAHDALAIASVFEDLGLGVAARSSLAWAHLTAGDFRRAVDVYRETLVVLGGPLAGERLGSSSVPAVVSRAFLVWALAELGEFETALTPAEEAIPGDSVRITPSSSANSSPTATPWMKRSTPSATRSMSPWRPLPTNSLASTPSTA